MWFNDLYFSTISGSGSTLFGPSAVVCTVKLELGRWQAAVKPWQTENPNKTAICTAYKALVVQRRGKRTCFNNTNLMLHHWAEFTPNDAVLKSPLQNHAGFCHSAWFGMKAICLRQGPNLGYEWRLSSASCQSFSLCSSKGSVQRHGGEFKKMKSGTLDTICLFFSWVNVDSCWTVVRRNQKKIPL